MRRWERDGRRRPRDNGTNPRALGTNPRARAAGVDSPAVAELRRYRRAFAVWVHRFGRGMPLCPHCDDTGWTDTGAGMARCTDHRALTAEEVAALLAL